MAIIILAWLIVLACATAVNYWLFPEMGDLFVVNLSVALFALTVLFFCFPLLRKLSICNTATGMVASIVVFLMWLWTITYTYLIYDGSLSFLFVGLVILFAIGVVGVIFTIKAARQQEDGAKVFDNQHEMRRQFVSQVTEVISVLMGQVTSTRETDILRSMRDALVAVPISSISVNHEVLESALMRLKSLSSKMDDQLNSTPTVLQLLEEEYNYIQKIKTNLK